MRVVAENYEEVKSLMYGFTGLYRPGSSVVNLVICIWGAKFRTVTKKRHSACEYSVAMLLSAPVVSFCVLMGFYLFLVKSVQ